MQMRTEEEKQMTLDWEPAEGRSKSRHLVEIRLQGGYQSQQENLHPPPRFSSRFGRLDKLTRGVKRFCFK